MSEAPKIPAAFLGGTLLFGTSTFLTAGTYCIFSGHPQPFRYSFFTTLNVGVAGGLFTGVRACLLHIPERFQRRELVDRDYIFASGISAGFVGGTFNLINSRGPKMAIPGLVMFSLAGFTGQFVLNALDNWRTRYIFEHEQEWQKTENPEPQNPKNHGLTEWERRFEFLGKYSGMKKTDPAKRLAVLRNEIEELDKKLQRVDDEIAKLERQKSQLQEKDNH